MADRGGRRGVASGRPGRANARWHVDPSRCHTAVPRPPAERKGRQAGRWHAAPAAVITTDSPHYCEALAAVETGAGFFRAASRPSRDLGVLLARSLASGRPVKVLDLMAGCGIRSLRYGLEGSVQAVWANDADGDRLPLLQANLAPLADRIKVETSARTAQQLLAELALRRDHHELVDLDAFGAPVDLLPAALQAVSLGGALYLASTDGRSATGHDRRAALRRFGAAARAHPASWELALRLQLGVVARTAWAQGRGIRCNAPLGPQDSRQSAACFTKGAAALCDYTRLIGSPGALQCHSGGHVLQVGAAHQQWIKCSTTSSSEGRG